jgi:hypothetical protein
MDRRPAAPPAEERPLRSPLLRRAWHARRRWTLRARNLRGFRFQGRRHRFLVARYNATWCNERQVEIPVVLHELDRSAPEERAAMLEVGNVLGHYGVRGHPVVDKYERAPGVLNEDFLDHRPARPYRLIVAVSTFEHIGWDEPDRDAGKFRRALRHAEALLAPGGRLLATVPLGHNPEVDRFVEDPPATHEVAFLERYGPGPGQWREAASCAGATHPYSPTRYASAVAVIRHRKPAAS